MEDPDGDTLVEIDEEREARIDKEMEAGGIAPIQPVQADYFGVDHEEKVYFPDKVTYVTVQELDEGARRKYLNVTNKDIRLHRQSGDAFLKMATGDERFHLMKSAIIDWNLVEKDKNGNVHSVSFSQSALDRFLDKGPPKVIDAIELKIRSMNPWLMADLSVEDIDQQIDELQQMKKTKLEDAEGNVS